MTKQEQQIFNELTATLGQGQAEYWQRRMLSADLVNVNDQYVRFEEIVAANFNISPQIMRKKTRIQPIKESRQILSLIAHCHLQFGLQETGMRIGGFDHSTVIYSCRKVRDLFATNKAFRAKVVNIMRQGGIDQPQYYEQMELKVLV